MSGTGNCATCLLQRDVSRTADHLRRLVGVFLLNLPYIPIELNTNHSEKEEEMYGKHHGRHFECRIQPS